ncbi:MAG: hypothetical protein ACU0BF_12350 [Paracoccaceae bacterium]
MGLAPELQILVLNAVILAVAYLGIYPSMTRLTPNGVALADLVLTGLSVTVAGLLFWGSGVGFSLILFDVNWFWFAFLTFAAAEMAILPAFLRARGTDVIRFFGLDALTEDLAESDEHDRRDD